MGLEPSVIEKDKINTATTAGKTQADVTSDTTDYVTNYLLIIFPGVHGIFQQDIAMAITATWL